MSQDQDRRKQEHPEIAKQIDQFIGKLEALKLVNSPFSIIFEDISGNCFVENPVAPKKDKNCEVIHFKRTTEQNHTLGIYVENEDVLLEPINEDEYGLEQIEGEVMTFQTNCPGCNSPCQTNMKMTSKLNLLSSDMYNSDLDENHCIMMFFILIFYNW